MYFLCSAPPHTFIAVTPALSATSTKVTAGPLAVWGASAARNSSGRVHLLRGVASASSSRLPKSKPEELRKRRRLNLILKLTCGIHPSNPAASLLYRTQDHTPARIGSLEARKSAEREVPVGNEPASLRGG